MSPYQTHQPLLFACARHAILHGGEVIELGCGMHSTPQLAAMFGKAFRSYETNGEWAKTIRRFGAPVIGVAGYDDVPVKPYAMVFIDNAPAERRKVDLLRFVDSRLVVVHDSDNRHAAIYDMERALAAYPYRFDHRLLTPNTTVVSRDGEAVRGIRDIFQ